MAELTLDSLRSAQCSPPERHGEQDLEHISKLDCTLGSPFQRLCEHDGDDLRRGTQRRPGRLERRSPPARGARAVVRIRQRHRGTSPSALACDGGGVRVYTHTMMHDCCVYYWRGGMGAGRHGVPPLRDMDCLIVD